MKGEWNGKGKVLKEDYFNLDEKLIKTINIFISKAQSKNIKVILVVSPTFKKIKPEFFNIVNEIAVNNEVQMLNYYNDVAFINNKKLFYDSEHLNDNGAKMFSKELANQIKF